MSKTRTPPGQVAMTGSQTVWTEAEWYGKLGQPTKHRPECSCGCVRPIASKRLAGVYAIPQAPWPIRTRYQEGQADCPNGCGSVRDFKAERKAKLDRVCLRCLKHTFDLRGPLLALSLMAARRAKKRDEAEKIRIAQIKRSNRPSKQGRRKSSGP